MGPEDILQMIQAYQQTAILRTGIELRVFDALANGAASAGPVAAAIGANQRGTRILLDALVAIGILEAAGTGTYRLTPVADAHLVRGRPAYLGDLTRIFASDYFWDRFQNLSRAVRQGGTVTDDHAETPEHPFWQDFATYSAAFAPAAETLGDILKPWASARRPLDALDLCCGSGLFGFLLARQQPHVRVWSLDWPNVLTITRGYAEQLGVLDRVQFIAGDVFEVPLGGPYDLVIASGVLHHFSEERCTALLRRLGDVLKPNGRIAIHEITSVQEPPTREPFPTLFSVLMLVWTREGEAHPLSTYQRMLAATGFTPPVAHDSVGIPTRWLIADRVVR